MAAGGASDDPPAQPRVQALHFEGVDAIPDEALETKLLTRAPDWWGLAFWRPDPVFDPIDLEEDLTRIGEIYREYGYFEASARSELEWDDGGEEVEVTILVEEGEPVRLEALEISLVPGSTLSQTELDGIEAGLDFKTGEVFGSRAYAALRSSLLDALAERSRPAARIDGGARVNLERRQARVEWQLDPGPFVRFGEIRLKGLEDVDPELARRELVVETGAPYSLRAQRRSERRLRDTELFHAVAIQPVPPEAASDPSTPSEETTAAAEQEPGEAEPAREEAAAEEQPGGAEAAQDEAASEEAAAEEEPAETASPTSEDDATQVWPLEVRLRERPPRSVRVAVGYGTEEQLRGQISWRHRNFLGGGRKLEIRGEYSSLLAGGELRFLQPRFIDPELELSSTSSFAWENQPAYEAASTKERIQLFRPLTDIWSIRTGYEFEYANVTEVAADAPEEEGSSRVSALFAGARRNTLDDRLAPTRGTWLDFYAEPALEAIGSSASYTTLVAEARGFVRRWGVVFGARLRGGVIQPMLGSGTDDVPIFERFFTGGSNSVRGYDYQSLGPRDDDDDPLGGLTLTEGSVEARVPLPWWQLSVVGFVDAGQLSRESWTFRARDIQYGAGPGLRLGTPVGPLRFDLGFPLNPRQGDPSFRIHFAVGNSF